MHLKKLFTISNLMLVLLILIVIVSLTKMGLSIAYIDINADASYYLGVPRVMLEGKTPLNDFPLGYTPMSFYMMMPLESIFGASFVAALVMLFCITLINGLIIYGIALQHSKNIILSGYAAALSLLLLTSLNGCQYELEPYVLLFGLSAVYFLGRERLRYTFVAGFMCFCAFWSKQYGLGFFILGIIYVLSDNGFTLLAVRRLGLLLLGFVLGLAIFLLLFLFSGVDLSLLASLSGSSYEREGIAGLLGAWKLTFIYFPLLLWPILILLLHPKKSVSNPLFITSFCGICGFMLQCYVRFYAHYMLLAIPFCVLIFVATYNLLRIEKIKKLFLILFLTSSAIHLYFSVDYIKGMLAQDKRQYQLETADAIDDFVPDNSSNVYASFDLLPITLINDYNPPLLKKYGFSNGFVREPEEVLEMLQVSDYCIISDRDLQKTIYTTEIKEYLDSNFNKSGEVEIAPQVECLIYSRK